MLLETPRVAPAQGFPREGKMHNLPRLFAARTSDRDAAGVFTTLKAQGLDLKKKEICPRNPPRKGR